jgi:general secretion pathway protein H
MTRTGLTCERRQAVFTLFERLLTLAIAASLAVMVMPNFGPAMDAARLKSATRDIASALRHARSLALRQRREIRFTLDIEKHLYSLSDKPKIYRLPESIELKLFTADSEVIDKGKGSVRFFPDGSSTGGRVTLVAGERKRLLDINWLTGAVIIKDTDSG